MGDEAAPYSWKSKEPVEEGSTAPTDAAFVARAGKALVTYPNGDTYDGSFNEAKLKHGRGIYTWSTAEGANPWVPPGGYTEGEPPVVRYEGQYVEGHRQGVGKMSYPNGERYHGHWAADKFSGEGTYYYKNGDIYSGEWKGGVRSGRGTFLFKGDESQLVGTWEKGHMVTGKWLWKDGTSWHGTFKDSQPVGRGVFYFPNGTAQEGEYVPDETDPGSGEMVMVWKGGPVHVASASAKEVMRPS